MSAVVGFPNTTPVAPQLEVKATETDNGAVIVGFIVSKTVTTCVAVVILLLESVAVQVTTVVPIGKTAGALFVTETDEQLRQVDFAPWGKR